VNGREVSGAVEARSLNGVGTQRWGVVLGSLLGLMVGNGPIMQFTFGIFLKPITEEFGWNRTQASLALVLGVTLTAICVPFAGGLMDRHGVRAVTLPAIALLAAFTAAVAFVATSPILFIVLYGLMGIAAAGQTPLPYAKAITAWFDDKRGLALGIAMAGVGLGAALIPQFAQALVSSYGWRGAYIGLGVGVFMLAFPAVLFLVKMPPRESGNTQPSAQALPGLSLREAAHTSEFRALAATCFLVACATNGTIAHVVPLLGDRGVTASEAAGSLAFAGLSLIIGRIWAGYMLDRMHGPIVSAVFFALPLIGIGLLAANVSSPALCVVLIGLGLGAEVDLIAYLTSRYMGLKSFGEIYGLLFAIFLLGSAVGPLVMGVSFDVFASYGPCIAVFAGALIAAIYLMLRQGEYRFPQR
jgi:MFS family permease